MRRHPLTDVLTNSPQTSTLSAPPPAVLRKPELSKRQKAAIIVRLMLEQGAELDLNVLPEMLQIELTHEMAALQSVDKVTLNNIIKEFLAELEDIGATFTGGIEAALNVMDGALSPANLRRLRRETGVMVPGDPWEIIRPLPVDSLLSIFNRESVEVSAVVLSKLPIQTSAALLEKMPRELANEVTHAVAMTETIDPDTVRAIGHTIAGQIAEQAPPAFDEAPASRIGAILNSSRQETRDGVLGGLTETDAGLGEKVRREIFTFANISERIETLDVAKITRAVDQDVLVTALASAQGDNALGAEFVLANMSQRMAAQLRMEIEELGTVRADVGEKAQAEVVAAIRALEAAGEISYVVPEED